MASRRSHRRFFDPQPRRSARSILRDPVTICIGIAPPEGRLFFATDTMASNDFRQVEGVKKSIDLTHDSKWVAMFSDGPTTFAAVVADIQAQLATSNGATEAQVKDACRAAYAREINDRVSRDVLCGYGGMTVDEFKLFGRQSLGDDLHDKLAAKIKIRSRLNLQLLVIGFDRDTEKRCLFEVTSRGCVEDCSAFGYHAIGSGAHKALAVLDQVDFFNHVHNEDAIVYWLLAAKLAAQNVTSVGHKNTSIFAIDTFGMWSSMFIEDVERLNKIRQSESLRIPKRAVAAIRESFLRMPDLEARGFKLAKRKRRR